MKAILFASIAALGIVVLLEPDRMMVVKANALNDRLRSGYPAGYSLDATHAPHVSMLQRLCA